MYRKIDIDRWCNYILLQNPVSKALTSSGWLAEDSFSCEGVWFVADLVETQKTGFLATRKSYK